MLPGSPFYENERSQKRPHYAVTQSNSDEHDTHRVGMWLLTLTVLQYIQQTGSTTGLPLMRPFGYAEEESTTLHNHHLLTAANLWLHPSLSKGKPCSQASKIKRWHLPNISSLTQQDTVAPNRALN